MAKEKPQKLVILWTTGDRNVALHSAFMYAHNGIIRGWWREICLIVWGSASVLLSEDEEVRNKLAKMVEDGVELRLCRSCALKLGVYDKLKELGYEPEPMGHPLTDMLQEGWIALTY